jgi:hypothetical protein
LDLFYFKLRYRQNIELYGPSPMFGINFANDNEGCLVSIGDDVTKYD